MISNVDVIIILTIDKLHLFHIYEFGCELTNSSKRGHPIIHGYDNIDRDKYVLDYICGYKNIFGIKNTRLFQCNDDLSIHPIKSLIIKFMMDTIISL